MNNRLKFLVDNKKALRARINKIKKLEEVEAMHIALDRLYCNGCISAKMLQHFDNELLLKQIEIETV